MSTSPDDGKKDLHPEPSASGLDEFVTVKNIWEVVKYEQSLGTGASAQVCLVTDRDDKVQYALKMMEHKHNDMFLRELRMLKRMDSPHIVRYKGAYRDYEKSYIMMEYCSGDSLIQRIANRKKYTEGMASNTAKMMLHSVKCLHDKHIVHRDLKPENFVYLTEKDAALKLLDFGIAMDALPNEPYSYRAGTPYYMAPEVVRNRETRTGTFCKKSDMWSLGVCIFIMLNGQAPFKGSSKNELFNNILFQNNIEFTTRGISDEAKDFVMQLLQREPKLRLTVDEALQHQWIVKCGKSENEIMASTVEALRFFNAKNTIHRALQNVAAANLDEHDEKHYKKLFDQFDMNGDGNITKEECVAALEINMLYTQEAERMAEEMIKASDDNKDNMIQYNEFKDAMARHGLSQDEYRMHAIFAALDTNRDGFISIAEFTNCLNTGNEAEMANIIQAFREADENKDDMLSFSEFASILQVSPERKKSALEALEPEEMDEVMNDNARHSQFIKDLAIDDAKLHMVDAQDQKVD